MGGGGGGRSKPPPMAAPLDVRAMMAASNESAVNQIKQQYKSLIENYPKLEELQLGTVKKLAGNLNNQETRDAQEYVRKGLALGEMDPNAAMPTEIEQSIYDAGKRDLALGRSLSPEQERAAQQSSRAAFAARGLGTSLGASAAEVLNRDALASARERDRQSFAVNANNLMIGNVANRRMALANLYNVGANNLIAADPYNRAVEPGLGLGGRTQAGMMQLTSNTFQNANQMVGDVYGFNANAMDSRYNAWANMQGANAQANASRQAGIYAGVGAGAGALLGVAAIAI